MDNSTPLQRAITLIRKGATRRAVERETGLPMESVRNLFAEIVSGGGVEKPLKDKIKAALMADPSANRSDIGRALGCSPNYVGQVALRIGLPKRFVRLSDAESRKINEMYEAGCNDAEVGRRIGRSPTAVADWRRRRNLKAIGTGSPIVTNEQRAKAVALVLRDGLSYTKAAAKIGPPMTRNIVAGAVYRARASA